MRGRVLVVDVVAVHDDPVARLPVAHRRADLHDHAGGVRADDVVRQVVALAPARLLAQALQEAEGGQGLEDRRPHRVEVDGARHHDDVGLVRGEVGDGDVLDVERLPGVLVRRRHAVEHAGVLLADHGRSVGLGERDGCDLVAGRVGLDRLEELLHTGNLPPANSGPPPRGLATHGVGGVGAWCGTRGQIACGLSRTRLLR